MDDALEAWAELDAARALHPADRLVLRSTEPARSLVLELLYSTSGLCPDTPGYSTSGLCPDTPPQQGPSKTRDPSWGPGDLAGDRSSAHLPERDLWNACARLGRMMAEEGASPSLASGTIDNAALAIGLRDHARVAPARASLLEGYVASVRDAERKSAAAAWDYPRCVVAVGDGVVTVACGHPPDDADALASWAERVASKLSQAKVKRAILGGTRGGVDPNETARAELASALELVGIALGPAPKSWIPWKR